MNLSEQNVKKEMIANKKISFYFTKTKFFNKLTKRQYILMGELTLITPTFLFSAVSLILLAYTNRFLSYAQLIRTLKDQYMIDKSHITFGQIQNLRKRVHLTKQMQVFGVVSLLLCVATMFLIYIGSQILSAYIFGVALVCLIISLSLSVREILISSKALSMYLSDMEKNNGSKKDK